MGILDAPGYTKAQSDSRYTRAFVVLRRDTNHPTAVKPLNAPIFTQAANCPLPSIYWPFLIDKRQWGGTGWVLAGSSNHASVHADSGLFVSTRNADSPVGAFPNATMLYRDDTGGNQTETPCCTYDAANNRLIWTWQQATPVEVPVAAQATIWGTTPLDMSAMTRQGVMLDVVQYADPGGDLHTGYFKWPFAIGGTYYGYGLYNGGNSIGAGRLALWKSIDMVNWKLVGTIPPQTHMLRPFGGGTVTGTPASTAAATTARSFDVRAKLQAGGLFEWRGRVWWIGTVGPNDSGGAIVSNRLCVAPMRPDLLGFAEPPIDITPPAQGWEGVGIDYFGNIVEYDGHLYGVYSAGGKQGGYGIVEVV